MEIIKAYFLKFIGLRYPPHFDFGMIYEIVVLYVVYINRMPFKTIKTKIIAHYLIFLTRIYL